MLSCLSYGLSDLLHNLYMRSSYSSSGQVTVWGATTSEFLLGFTAFLTICFTGGSYFSSPIPEGVLAWSVLTGSLAIARRISQKRRKIVSEIFVIGKLTRAVLELTTLVVLVVVLEKFVLRELVALELARFLSLILAIFLGGLSYLLAKRLGFESFMGFPIKI